MEKSSEVCFWWCCKIGLALPEKSQLVLPEKTHIHLKEQSMGDAVRRQIRTVNILVTEIKTLPQLGHIGHLRQGGWGRESGEVWGGLGDGAVCKPSCIRTTDEDFSASFFLGPMDLHGWTWLGAFKVLPRILMWCLMLLESHVLKDAAWPRGSGARACFYGAVAQPSLSSSRGDPRVPHYIFLPPFKRRGPETVWVLKLKPTTETQKGKFWSWKHAGGQHAILILSLV